MVHWWDYPISAGVWMFRGGRNRSLHSQTFTHSHFHWLIVEPAALIYDLSVFHYQLLRHQLPSSPRRIITKLYPSCDFYFRDSKLLDSNQEYDYVGFLPSLIIRVKLVLSLKSVDAYHGTEENSYGIWSAKVNKRYGFEDIGLDRTIILKWILQNRTRECKRDRLTQDDRD